eukprot:Sdes_comp22510_c0_seq1m20957
MGAFSLKELLSFFSAPSLHLSRSDHLVLKYCRLYFALAFSQFLITTIFNVVMIILQQSFWREKRGVYSFVFIFISFHQLFLVYNGIKRTNFIEIIAFVFFNTIYAFYGVIEVYDFFQLYQVSDPDAPPSFSANSQSGDAKLEPKTHNFNSLQASNSNIKIMLILSVFSVVYYFLCTILSAFFTIGIVNQFRWESYKLLGNNFELHRLWIVAMLFDFILSSSLIFSFVFFFINAVVILSPHTFLFWLCCFVLPLIPLHYYFSYYVFLQRESRCGAYVFFLVQSSYLGFYIYVLVYNIQGELWRMGGSKHCFQLFILIMSIIHSTLLLSSLFLAV